MGRAGGVREARFSVQFWLTQAKVELCPRKEPHDFIACPWLHANEAKARRRDPRTHTYSSELCPNMQRDKTCPRGDACSFAHNIFERNMHADRFRRTFCEFGPSCTRHLCFFAHSPAELRTCHTVGAGSSASRSSSGSGGTGDRTPGSAAAAAGTLPPPAAAGCSAAGACCSAVTVLAAPASPGGSAVRAQHWQADSPPLGFRSCTQAAQPGAVASPAASAAHALVVCPPAALLPAASSLCMAPPAGARALDPAYGLQVAAMPQLYAPAPHAQALHAAAAPLFAGSGAHEAAEAEAAAAAALMLELWQQQQMAALFDECCRLGTMGAPSCTAPAPAGPCSELLGAGPLPLGCGAQLVAPLAAVPASAAALAPGPAAPICHAPVLPGAGACTGTGMDSSLGLLVAQAWLPRMT